MVYTQVYILTKVLLRHPWIRAPCRSTKWLPDGHSSSNFDEQPSNTPEGEGETGGGVEASPKMDPRSIADASLEGTMPEKRHASSSLLGEFMGFLPIGHGVSMFGRGLIE